MSRQVPSTRKMVGRDGDIGKMVGRLDGWLGGMAI